MPRFTVAVPRDAGEVATLCEIIDQSFAGFGMGAAAVERWAEHLGRESLRVVRADGEVVGGLGILKFGQFFGGASVPSAGISCVAIRPDQRGAGAGKRLMRSVVRGLARDGFALSVLYPSTWGLYRAADYEVAGTRITHRLDARKLAMRDRTLTMRPMTEADHEAIRAVHTRRAVIGAGCVDRSPHHWRRLLWAPLEGRKYAYVVEGPGGAPEGYLIYTQHFAGRAPYEMRIVDHAATTPAAGRRLLTFLSDHATMARDVIFDAGPVEQLLVLAPDENLAVHHQHFWMLRILNLRQALTTRAYPSGVRAEVHLEVTGDLIADNNGRLVLRVADGRGVVRQGGRGRIRGTIRDLAPLYTGFMSPAELHAAGFLEGSADALADAAAVFAGPAPWMNDRF